jgi:hypothetical protein
VADPGSRPAAAPPPPDARIGEKVDYLVTAWLPPALAPLRFARFRRTLHRTVVRDGCEAVQVVHLQGSKWNRGRTGEFFVNLAVQLPALVRLVAELPQDAWWLEHLGKVDEVSCALRADLRHALPAEPADWWPPDLREMQRHGGVAFLVRTDEDLVQLGSAVARAVAQYGVPWLNDHSSFEAAWGPFDEDPLRYGGQCARLAAGILLGRHAEAAVLFAEKADRLAGSPERFAEVKAWAIRHGLDVHGVGPTPPRSAGWSSPRRTTRSEPSCWPRWRAHERAGPGRGRPSPGVGDPVRPRFLLGDPHHAIHHP